VIEGVAARQGIGGVPAVIDRIGISVVTPMNNEQECVEEFLRRTDAVLASMPGDHEIVIVDDGSTDRTPALLDAALTHMRRLRVVTLARNVGQCSALMAGLQASRGSTVVVMDGDLQNAPEDIPALVTELDRGHDLVSGFRGGRVEGPIRRIPSRLANWLLRRVSGCEVRDMGGYKVLRGDLARSLRLRPGQHRLLPAIVHMRGGSTSEIRVQHHARYAGRSHYGISRTLDVLIDIVLLWMQGSFKSRPMYLFGRVGIVLIAIDCVIMPWLLYEKFAMGKDMGTRPPFLVAIMLFLSALFIFAAGFMLELLSEANNTVGGVKPYLVRSVRQGHAG
jgi:glycosyltransferase involved in cell wall biosynthesis